MDDNTNNIHSHTRNASNLLSEWKEVSSASAKNGVKKFQPSQCRRRARPADDPGRWSGGSTPEQKPRKFSAAPAGSVVVDIPPAGTSWRRRAKRKFGMGDCADCHSGAAALRVCPILIWAAFFKLFHFLLGLLLLI